MPRRSRNCARVASSEAGKLAGLRLGRLPLRPAVFGHELVEFSLVLGVPQAIEERLELALLFFEPPQSLVAILVKRAIAARTAETSKERRKVRLKRAERVGIGAALAPECPVIR